jgi:hypothetical protein
LVQALLHLGCLIEGDPMKTLITRVALAAALLSPPGAPFFAQDLKTTERLDIFRQLDANGDSFLSSAEAAKRPEVAAGFKDADANRDGRLSFAEFERIRL